MTIIGYQISAELRKQRERLSELLRRHVREEDSKLSDMDFVKAVLKRLKEQRGWEIVDPAE